MRKLIQTIELPLERYLHSRAERRALVHQRADRDIPTVADFSEHIFNRNANIVEKQFTKLALAGELAQRTHFHARTLHVHQNVGQSLVLGGSWIGSRQQRAPIGGPSVAGPDFLPIDDVVVAVELGLAAKIGKVGACVGFRESLAPDLVGAQNIGEKSL